MALVGDADQEEKRGLLSKDEADQGELPEAPAEYHGLHDDPPEYLNFPMAHQDCDIEDKAEPPPVMGDGYRDLWWGIAFLVNTGILVPLLAVYYHTPRSNETHPDEASVFDSVVMCAVGIAGICSVFISALFLGFVSVCTRQAIWAGLVTNGVVLMAMAVLGFSYGYLYSGLLACIMLPLYVCWVYFIQSRIQLATEMITISLSVNKRFQGVYAVTAGCLVCSSGFILFWGCTAFSLFKELESTAGPKWSVAIWLFFTLMWALYTIQYVCLLAVSGTIATWYFEPTSQVATLPALKRAVTTSFGSACFAALIIATIETLEQIAHFARRSLQRNSDNQCLTLVACFIMCCFECLLSCLGDIVRFVNRYSLCITAIYGDTYCQGVQTLMDIFKTQNGIDLIINDDLVSLLIMLGALVTGLSGAGIAAVYVYAQDGTTGQQILLAAVAAALVSFMVQAAVLSVLSTSVSTLYVCIALDPAVLRVKNPEYFARIQRAWYARWGGDGPHQVHLDTRGRGYQQQPH